MKKKFICMVIVCCVCLTTLTNVHANIYYGADCGLTFTVNNIKLPAKGYELGNPHNNCWVFANDIYYLLWKTGNGKNLLRNLSGDKLKITMGNTEKYIRASQLGAHIRVEDGKGVNEHSLILVDKDADGFTTYEGNFDGGIYFNYYTYRGFAEHYADYKYFEYIEWPNAPAYSNSMLADCGIYYTDLQLNDSSINLTINEGKGYKITLYAAEYSDNILCNLAKKDISISSDEEIVSMVYNKKNPNNVVKFFIWKDVVPLPTY